MGYTPNKGAVEEFHAAASVKKDATVTDVEALLAEQAKTLHKAIDQQIKWMEEGQRAARQDGVDHSNPHDRAHFRIVFGQGLKSTVPEQIRRMTGYQKIHDICKEWDVQVGIERNGDGTTGGIKIDVTKGYADSPAADSALRVKTVVKNAPSPAH